MGPTTEFIFNVKCLSGTKSLPNTNNKNVT